MTLRATWNVGGWYEFFHHIFLARAGGISIDTVERIARGATARGLTAEQRALIVATDELHDHRALSPKTRAELGRFLTGTQMRDLCVLVGHYEMLAMLLKSAGAEPEPGAWRRGPLSWLRAADDSDRLMPGWLPRVNKHVTNRIQGLWAPYLPPYAVIVHRGRTSGRVYRTPLNAFRVGDRLVILLVYGDRSDWVRNLLAADRGGVERLGRLHAITNIRVTDAATDGDLLPRALRPAARLAKILIADIEDVR